MAATPGITFDQQKERMMLQLAHQEQSRAHQEQSRAKDRELEHAKNRLQQEQIQLAREGRLSGVGLMSESFLDRTGDHTPAFDAVRNLRMLPKFSEEEPKTFFELFEHIAEGRNWPDRDRVDMLRSIFTGKAQEAYSSLSREDSCHYDKVKEAVLQAYELIPEAYRQRFRTIRKTEKQTWAEHGRDLTRAFNRWYSSLEITNFAEMCELMRVEQIDR